MRKLEGGILEAFGKLFTKDLSIYVYPLRDQATGQLKTVENVEMPLDLRSLYRHLVERSRIKQLDNYDDSVLHIFSRDVLRRIKDQDASWEDAGGRFTVGTALEVDGLIEAGIEDADVFLAATSGDNTNLVISQIAQRRFDVPRVVVRVADPGRAAWYAEQGLLTICPTQIAIDQAERLVLER